jgi:hypothetical protein
MAKHQNLEKSIYQKTAKIASSKQLAKRTGLLPTDANFMEISLSK